MVVAMVAAGTALATDETAKSVSSDDVAKVPDEFKVKFETTCGDFVVEVHREWAPLGVDRFHELVTAGFYDESGFFRVVPGFVVQFGLSADPKVQEKWSEARIKDDPVTKSNKRGFITFATAGPDTRTSQVFINYKDNVRLDRMGFAPFGEVVEGMDVVDKISAAHGQEPDQERIKAKGNEYLKSSFPKLDYITKATILEPAP
jgi:peptidyl-prolyl cis-trans isomerase A (cyclophilin A)